MTNQRSRLNSKKEALPGGRALASPAQWSTHLRRGGRLVPSPHNLQHGGGRDALFRLHPRLGE